MTFLHPWGLLALLAIPVILGLHFFRQQKRSREIGGLHLWDFARIATPAGRRFERLIGTLPLLFQLLAAVLLALLLGGLDWPINQSARHYSVILDDSVSMQARVGDSTSAGRAVKALEGWARDGDRFTVVAASGRPSVIAGPAAQRHEVVRALQDWSPAAPVANLDEAMNIATKFGSEDSRLLLLTDHPDGAQHLAASASVWGVGRSGVNNAIVFADRFRATKESDKVIVKVDGYGGLKRPVTLTAYRGEEVLSTQQIEVESSQTVSLEFELPDTKSPIRLSLSPEDDLAADDNAILVPVEIKPVRVYMAENLPQRAAFEKAVLSVRETLLAPTPADADLAFVTPEDAAEVAAVRRVYLVPAARETTGGLRLAAGRDLVTAGGSDLTRNLGMAGVVWAFDRETPANAPLALRSEISYTSVPLLFADRATSTSARYRMDIIMDGSNITRHTAWPVLLMNIVEECRDALPGLERTNLRAGEELRLNLEPDAAAEQTFTLWREGDPTAARTWQQALPTAIDDLVPGTYTIRQGTTIEAPSLAVFRVNLFSQSESNLIPLTDAKPDLKTLDMNDLEQTQRNYLLFYLLVLGLIACVVLAWIYQDAGH